MQAWSWSCEPSSWRHLACQHCRVWWPGGGGQGVVAIPLVSCNRHASLRLLTLPCPAQWAARMDVGWPLGQGNGRLQGASCSTAPGIVTLPPEAVAATTKLIKRKRRWHAQSPHEMHAAP